MSPELGICEARGEVCEHHHRRKERHDPLVAEAERGHPTTVDDRRPDEIGELGARVSAFASGSKSPALIAYPACRRRGPRRARSDE